MPATRTGAGVPAALRAPHCHFPRIGYVLKKAAMLANGAGHTPHPA